MAQSKKASSETKTLPQKSTKQPSNPKLDVSSFGKTVKQRVQDKPVLFTLVGVLIFFVLVAGGLFFYQRSLFIAGSVNGELITSPEFYSKLIKASGSETFDSMTQKILIKSEARKKNITVSEEEIDKRMEEIEKSLGSKAAFEDALKQNNLSKQDLREQLAIQLLVEKLLADKIKVTEEEVDKYLAENTDSQTPMTRDQVKDTIKSTKVNTEFEKWYQEIKTKAKIYKYF